MGRKVWNYYKVEDNGIKKLKNKCPRCGAGTFMAEHKDRYSCGKCGYTEWKEERKLIEIKQAGIKINA